MNRDEEMRELRLRIEALEQAIVDADEALVTAEGFGLLEYLESDDGYDESSVVINSVLEA